MGIGPSPPPALIRNQDQNPSWVSNNPQNSLWLIIAIGAVDRSVHALWPLHLIPDNLSWMRRSNNVIKRTRVFVADEWRGPSYPRPHPSAGSSGSDITWVLRLIQAAVSTRKLGHAQHDALALDCGQFPKIREENTQQISEYPSYLSRGKSQLCVAHLGVTMVFKESLVMDTKGSETNVGWLEEKESARERKVGQPSPFSGYTTKLNSNWRERMPCLRLNDRCSLWVFLTTRERKEKKTFPIKTLCNPFTFALWS